MPRPVDTRPTPGRPFRALGPFESRSGAAAFASRENGSESAFAGASCCRLAPLNGRSTDRNCRSSRPVAKLVVPLFNGDTPRRPFKAASRPRQRPPFPDEPFRVPPRSTTWKVNCKINRRDFSPILFAIEIEIEIKVSVRANASLHLRFEWECLIANHIIKLWRPALCLPDVFTHIKPVGRQPVGDRNLSVGCRSEIRRK
jgi:hypothetical protein